MIDNVAVVNVGKYIKEHKLSFRPDTLMMFVWKQGLIIEPDERMDSTDTTPDTCDECWKTRDKLRSNSALCRKHKAIHDWQIVSSTNKMGVGILQNHRFVLYSSYAVFENLEDPTHVYVVWFGSCEKKAYSMYSVKTKYFKDIFKGGYDIQELLDPDMVLFNGNWQVYYPDNEGLPAMENIRY